MRFGANEYSGQGQRYLLSTVITDEHSRQLLQQYLEAGERSGQFAGLRELPPGARLQIHQIYVRR